MVLSIPNLAVLGLTIQWTLLTEQVDYRCSYWSYCQVRHGQIHTNQNANYTNYDTSIGNGWRYNWVGKYTYGGNYNDYIQMTIVIEVIATRPNLL